MTVPYVNLSHVESSSFLYFGSRGWKRKYFILPYHFSSILELGYLLFFILFLFGLRSRSALYLLKDFIKIGFL